MNWFKILVHLFICIIIQSPFGPLLALLPGRTGSCCFVLVLQGSVVCLAWPGDPLLSGGFPARTAPACGLAWGQSCSLLCLCQSPRGLKGQSWSPSSSLNPPNAGTAQALSVPLALALISFHFDGLLYLRLAQPSTRTLFHTHTAAAVAAVWQCVCLALCVASHQTRKYFG